MFISKLFSLTLVFLMIFGGVLFAEEISGEQESVRTPEKKEDSPVKLGGKVYLNWHINMTEGTDSDPDGSNYKNTFAFERLYMTGVKTFDDIYSFKVTLDIGNDAMLEGATIKEADFDDDGTDEEYATGKAATRYRLFVKNAYIQAKKLYGDITATLRAGMVGTPVISFTEKMIDQRWIGKNVINGSGTYTPDGSSIDISADMGVWGEVDIFKKAVITASVTNGEGFKSADESKAGASSEGKAYYGMINIIPLESLYISGYYRLEGLNTSELDYNEGYYGGGIAWKDDAISAGLNYYQLFYNVDGEAKAYSSGGDINVSLAELWFNLSMRSMTEIPLFIMTKYAYGKDADMDDSQTTLTGAGLGYEYSKNIRVIAWYQQIDSEAADAAEAANPEKSFWVKTEIKW